MKRKSRVLSCVIVAVLAPGCAEDEVREPGPGALNHVQGLIPGRVYNDGPDSSALTAERGSIDPTSTTKLRRSREREIVVVADDPGDGQISPDIPSQRPRDPLPPFEHSPSRTPRHRSPISFDDPDDQAELDDPANPADHDPFASHLRKLEQQVLEAHNQIRANHALPPLELSPRLRAAAYRQARDMARHKVMSHRGTDGSKANGRIEATGYRYRRIGENVACGRFAAEGLMRSWMESPHHKENILGSYSQIGVAYATAADGVRYWCVTFGLPASH